ncbi:hypothetical protein SDC9_104417 [bioreactor metagenome]|uniref:Uncharacterized protein n=1 Tax=bioreactor metagenome TaxID=1076179 RepID=A0A645AWH2_9ZZZZ
MLGIGGLLTRLLRAHLVDRPVQYNGGGFISNAHTIDAEINQFEEPLPRADAAGAFDLTAALCHLHHRADHLRRRAFALFTNEKARGCLHKIRARRNGGLGCAPNLVHGERVGFEDDLEHRAVLMANLCNRADILFDLSPHATPNPTVVRDDIQVLNIPVLTNLLRLHHLRGGRAQAKRKIADHADARLRSLAEFPRDGKRSGIDAYGCAAEINAFLDILYDVILRKLRLEHRLVDIGGEFRGCHFRSFFGWFHGLVSYGSFPAVRSFLASALVIMEYFRMQRLLLLPLRRRLRAADDHVFRTLHCFGKRVRKDRVKGIDHFKSEKALCVHFGGVNQQ